MSDPFGEEPAPWWRRVMRPYGSAPKRYARPAEAVGPIVAFLVPAPHGMDLPTKLAISAALFFALPALVDAWWKQRRRREGELLLVLPEEQAERRTA